MQLGTTLDQNPEHAPAIGWQRLYNLGCRKNELGAPAQRQFVRFELWRGARVGLFHVQKKKSWCPWSTSTLIHLGWEAITNSDPQTQNPIFQRSSLTE